jgi:hypothetical protein
VAKKVVVKNPGQTPSDEIDKRVEITETLLARGMRKSDIKQYLKGEFGITARTCESYLARARDLILLKLRSDRDEHRAMALAFYQTVRADASASFMERLRAQQQIDHLLGLHAPWKVAQTTTDGKDVLPTDVDDRLSALASRIADRIGDAGATGIARSQGRVIGKGGGRKRGRPAKE